MGLSEGELLRAKTLELLDGAGTIAQQQTVEEAWDEILAIAPERVDEGLRWIYASRVGQRPGKTTLFDDCLRAFFPVNDSAPLTAVEAETLVSTTKELRDEFSTVAKLLDGVWPFPTTATPKVTNWDRDRLRLLVVDLKHTNCMPLLLAAAQRIDQARFSEVVQALERFVFRYKIVVDAHIGPATTAYHKHAVSIRDVGRTYKVSELANDLRDLINARAPDQIFRARLREMSYSKAGNNKPLKYYILTLEHYARRYEDGAAGKPKCKDKARLFDMTLATIEHVYAEKTTPPKPALEPLIHRVGNLTILGQEDNGAAGNKPFALKKPIFAVSSMLINRIIAAHADWDTPDIERHEGFLQDVALKVFTV